MDKSNQTVINLNFINNLQYFRFQVYFYIHMIYTFAGPSEYYITYRRHVLFWLFFLPMYRKDKHTH